MTKTTAITLSIALGLLVLAFLALQQHSRSLQRSWIAGFANDLLTTTNSTRAVAIGPELRGRLAELMTSTTHVLAIRNGDAPEIGDGRAKFVLVLTNAQGDSLAIRLRSAESNKLHIVGFWTPNGVR